MAYELMDTVPDIKDAPGAVSIERTRGRVTFEGVRFSYSGRVDTLKDSSFEAPPGQAAAVVHVTRADGVRTAVDPHEHGAAAVVGSGRVDVQEKAVLVGAQLAGRDQSARHRRRLGPAGTLEQDGADEVGSGRHHAAVGP